MNTIISNITVISECDSVISKIDEKLTDLNYKLGVETHKRNRMLSTSTSVNSEHAKTVEDLAEITAKIPTLAVGPDLDEALTEQARLNYRLLVLSSRKKNFSPEELIEAEADIQSYQGSIANLTALKSDAEARKAELQSQSSAAA